MTVKMHIYTKVKASGFIYRKPQVNNYGNIKTEAKSFENPWTSIYSDTSRCADCAVAGCSGGCVATISMGCPFEHRIGDVHTNFQKALEVLADNQVFETLKNIAPEIAKQIDPFTDPDDPLLVQKLVRYPITAFNALKEKGLSSWASRVEGEFNRYMKEAYKLSEEKGPMHDLFGRICPDSLCKDVCTTNNMGSVEIPKNMTLVADYAWEAGFVKPPQPKHGEIDKNILIIGSGFASLSAAYKLRELGYQVTIVEKNKAPAEPGNNQILPYKVMHERFNRHVENLEGAGVNFITGMEVGQGENTVETLKER